MSNEEEMKELESIEINSGKKVKHFIGSNKQELEKKLWKYVFRHNIDISLLVCRKKRYSLYY